MHELETIWTESINILIIFICMYQYNNKYQIPLTNL